MDFNPPERGANYEGENSGGDEAKIGLARV